MVLASEHIGAEVAGLVCVSHREHSRRLMLRGFDVVDECALRHAGQWRCLSPGVAAVFRSPDQAIVRAGVKDAFLNRRFADCGQRGVLRHGAVVIERVDAPDAVHEFERVAVGVARQVVADGRPRVAAVVAAPQALRAEVQATARVRADQQRGIPVEPFGSVAGRRLGLDVDDLVAVPIDPLQVPDLGLHVHGVRIVRVEGDAVAVGPERHGPVLVADAVRVHRP